MEYNLLKPEIKEIIDLCDRLLANEKLTVFDFGKNQNLTLHIYKDSEFDPETDMGYSNLVDVYTFKDGKAIDDAIGIYVTDGSLENELNRIFDCRDMKTL